MPQVTLVTVLREAPKNVLLLKVCFVEVKPPPEVQKSCFTSVPDVPRPSSWLNFWGVPGDGFGCKSCQLSDLEKHVKKMLKMTPKGMPRGTLKSSKIKKNHKKSWPRCPLG